jgi:hypothetical protein
MPTTTPVAPVERAAAALLAVQALGVAVLVGWQLISLAQGDTVSLSSALALILLTAGGAVLLAAFAAAVWRGVSWGRSGGIVVQLLVLAVAAGAATGTYGHPSTGLMLATPALITLVTLVLATRAAAARR